MLEFQLYSQPGKGIAIHDSLGMELFHDANLGLFFSFIFLFTLLSFPGILRLLSLVAKCQRIETPAALGNIVPFASFPSAAQLVYNLTTDSQPLPQNK
ncbi:hypothetical protein BDV39DRAFT_184538 [Aspergillus sergii]|uniref:Uncharacterized protein n=1 Tax=Aspergillus sergii TaxID=1034303 RepID=A0A5N6WMJ8_9EURO|nr:hypothetical protein BDV39DRAFT_184538 [Aspergillus sergii]